MGVHCGLGGYCPRVPNFYATYVLTRFIPLRRATVVRLPAYRPTLCLTAKVGWVHLHQLLVITQCKIPAVSFLHHAVYARTKSLSRASLVA